MMIGVLRFRKPLSLRVMFSVLMRPAVRAAADDGGVVPLLTLLIEWSRLVTRMVLEPRLLGS